MMFKLWLCVSTLTWDKALMAEQNRHKTIVFLIKCSFFSLFLLGLLQGCLCERLSDSIIYMLWFRRFPFWDIKRPHVWYLPISLWWAIPLEGGTHIIRNFPSTDSHTRNTELKQYHLKLVRDIQHYPIQREGTTFLIYWPECCAAVPRARAGLRLAFSSCGREGGMWPHEGLHQSASPGTALTQDSLPLVMSNTGDNDRLRMSCRIGWGSCGREAGFLPLPILLYFLSHPS